MSVLKWIWGLLKKVFGLLRYLADFIATIASSVLAWIIAGFAWLLHQLYDKVGDFFYNLFAELEDFAVGQLPVAPFADWLGRDLLALDVAWECIVIYVALWFSSRLARTAGGIVRLIVDLL